MADNSVETVASPVEPRTVGQKVIFWLLWVILLTPVIILLVATLTDSMGILLLPALIQAAIHGVSLKWFLDTAKPFSKSMLMLLGGTGLMYFLALGSCVVILMSLSGSNFH